GEGVNDLCRIPALERLTWRARRRFLLSLSHRNQPVGRGIELPCRLLDRLALVGGLDKAKPHLFGSDLVNAPRRRLGWFCFLRHTGSIGEMQPAALPSGAGASRTLHRVGRMVPCVSLNVG